MSAHQMGRGPVARMTFDISVAEEGEFSPCAAGRDFLDWLPGTEPDVTRRMPEMDGSQFDTLLRGLTIAKSRRGALLGLLGGTLGLLGPRETEARHHHKKHKKKGGSPSISPPP